MSSLPVGPLRVALFGAGRVGTAVATLLSRRGHDIVAVSSPHEASAEAAAARLQAPVVEPSAIQDAQVILIGAPDGALSDAVARLGRSTRGAVLVHFAGSAGIEPLREAQEAAALCALHPVQACPDADTAVERLPGSAWGVTCSENARGWSHALINDELGGTPFDVGEEDRVLWHAAAVTTSNGIAALMSTGELLLSSIGVASPGDVLGPISAGTVTNVREARSAGSAVTGPVVRGEIDVIARHSAEVRTRVPELLPAYTETVEMIVSGAKAAGRIGDDIASGIRAALERP